MFDRLKKIIENSTDEEFRKMLDSVGDPLLADALKNARLETMFLETDLDVCVDDEAIHEGFVAWCEEAFNISRCDDDLQPLFDSVSPWNRESGTCSTEMLEEFLKRDGADSIRSFKRAVLDRFWEYGKNELREEMRDSVSLSIAGGSTSRRAAVRAFFSISPEKTLPLVVEAGFSPVLVDSGALPLGELMEFFEKSFGNGVDVKVPLNDDFFRILTEDLENNGGSPERIALHAKIIGEGKKEKPGEGARRYMETAAALGDGREEAPAM